MTECDFCGGPRLNGSPMRRDEDGRWRLDTSANNPMDPNQALACRSCAKKYVGTTAEG